MPTLVCEKCGKEYIAIVDWGPRLCFWCYNPEPYTDVLSVTGKFVENKKGKS